MTLGRDTADPGFEKADWAIRETVSIDIRCAARSTAPVLITGPGRAAESIALEIHRRGPAVGHPFTVVDCEQEERLAALLQYRRNQDRGTLLLLGVHRLSPDLQRQLKQALRHSNLRIVASTPVDLQHADTFDERLFYRLNIIHIDLTSEE